MSRQERIDHLNDRRGRLAHDVLTLQFLSTTFRSSIMRDTRDVISRARDDVRMTGADVASDAGEVARRALRDTRTVASEQTRTLARNADPRQVVSRYPAVGVGVAAGVGLLGVILASRGIEQRRRRQSLRPITTQY